MKLSVALLVILTALAAAPRAQDAVTAFVGGTIVDGTGAAPIDNGVILVSNGRITAVGPAARVSAPGGATRVDLRGKTILPGFINAHGHVGGEGSGASELEAQLLLYARYGVTTVFSLGGDGPASIAVRDAPARGRARLFVAGPVITGTTPDLASAAVEKNAAMKVDWVKIRVDDNLGTATKVPADAWTAALARAHQRGLPVAAHLFYLDDAKALLRERIDLLAHSVRDTAVDAEFIRLARGRDACVSPTLTREVSTFVYETTPAFFADAFFLRHADKTAMAQLVTPARQQQVRDSPSAQRYKVALDQASRNVKLLADGGVRLAMGTDSGATGRFQGYFEHMELELMVKAGLTPMQAIVAATGDAARCMKKSGVIGTIAPGALADLVVYTANPVSDIRNTRTIESVWIGGGRL